MRIAKFFRSRPFKIWLTALVVPILIVIIVQFPLCHNKILSDFFSQLPTVTALQILSVVFALPSFILIGITAKGAKRKIIHLIVLTLIFAAYLPPLWVLGFYTSRHFFEGCIA